MVRIARGTEMPQAWSDTAKLKHPHILQRLDGGEDELQGTLLVYAVTEKPDDSLEEAVRVRALSAKEAREVVRSVLEALTYLHAEDFVHGAVDPGNIVAVGEKIKLAPWTITRRTGEAAAGDMLGVGQTVVEILTQQRPAAASDVRADMLPPPFGSIALGCLRQQYTAREALAVLEGRIESIPAPAQARRLPWGAIAAMLAGVLLLVIGVRASRQRSALEPSAQTAVNSAENATRQRVREPVPPPVIASPKQNESGDWAVVAAIYKNHKLAVRRANQMTEHLKSWDVKVFPSAGQGQRYMVVLAFAESRRQADRLRAKARAAGMPRDTYVTKISR